MVTLRQFITASLMVLSLGACSTAPMNTNVAKFGASLSGKAEVPENTSMGSGMLEATLDKTTSVLTWTVTYTGLTGAVKAGHFHGPAAAGANAGVALGFAGSVESPIKGSAAITAAQVADLMAGKWYVNLHTAANPGGEIRGQVTAAP